MAGIVMISALADPASNLMAAEPMVSIGTYHHLYLKTDGSAWASGRNFEGYLGNGTYEARSRPVRVLDDVQQVSAGTRHSLFLKKDGTAYGAGRSAEGQLGAAFYNSQLTPVALMSGVKSVLANEACSFFLKTDGSVWACGEGSGGRLGDGVLGSHNVRELVKILENVSSMAAASSFTLFLKTDGTVWGTGSNQSGQFGPGGSSAVPVKIDLEGIVKIACGRSHCLFLKNDGSVWVSGSNNSGETGDVPVGPAPRLAWTGVRGIAAGTNFSVILKEDGTAWAIGSNANGQLGMASPLSTNVLVKVMENVSSVSASQQTAVFIDTENRTWIAGTDSSGAFGTGIKPSYPHPPQPVFLGAVEVSANAFHSLFLKKDGTVWGTGSKVFRREDDDGLPYRYFPEKVPGLENVTSISAGDHHALFLEADGSVWSVGRNLGGELVDGTTQSRVTLRRVMEDVKAVSAGSAHSLILKNNGDLLGCGYNHSGQLGTGNTATQVTPTLIATDVEAISAGSRHSLFRKTNKTIWACGGLGQSYEVRLYPFQVSGGTDMFAGSNHSLVATSGGSVYVGGEDLKGQLGLVPSNRSYSSLQLLRNPVLKARNVWAGFAHSFIITETDEVWAAGDNSRGQWGDGTTITRERFVKVMEGVKKVSGGDYFSLFLKEDGVVWGAGDNQNGELGLGAGNSPGMHAGPNLDADPGERWREARFGNIADNPGISAWSADPDGDGFTNLIEWALDLNPFHGEFPVADYTKKKTGLPRWSVSGEGESKVMRMEFLRRIDSGLTYTPIVSESLEPGTFRPMGGTSMVLAVDGQWETVIHEEVVGDHAPASRFATLRVTKSQP